MSALSLLVRDIDGHPEVRALSESSSAVGIASCAGVVLRADSVVVGSLCELGHRRSDTLGPHDLSVLRALGDVAVPLLSELDRPVVRPLNRLRIWLRWPMRSAARVTSRVFTVGRCCRRCTSSPGSRAPI